MDRTLWSRILLILGLFGMLVGALDPLEGSILIAPSTGIAAAGALVGHTRHRRLLYLGFFLITIGVGSMFLLSTIGGVGGPSGTSTWWALTIVPYPIGWILALVAAALALLDSFRHRPATA